MTSNVIHHLELRSTINVYQVKQFMFYDVLFVNL